MSPQASHVKPLNSHNTGKALTDLLPSVKSTMNNDKQKISRHVISYCPDGPDAWSLVLSHGVYLIDTDWSVLI